MKSINSVFAILFCPILALAEPCPTRGQFVVGEKGLETNAFFIQQALAYLDSWPDDVQIDGSLGPITSKAISAFQKKHGLPQTGDFDIVTQTQIAQILSAETPFPKLVENKLTSFYAPNFSPSTQYENGSCTVHLDFDNDELDQDFSFETPFECRLLEIDGDPYYWQNLDTTAVAIQLKISREHEDMINAEFIVVRPDGEIAYHDSSKEEIVGGILTNNRSETLENTVSEYVTYTTLPRNWETKTTLSDVDRSFKALSKPPLEGQWQFRRWSDNSCLYHAQQNYQCRLPLH